MDELDATVVGTAEAYRRRKATSVLAIVFTDIVNSTHLREELGEFRYEDLREEYETGFAEIICREDAGVVVKGTGDGAIAVFSEPSTAVERCLEVQESMEKHPEFKLRIGIDMGQVSVKSSFGIVADVFGSHVNRASRIQALAAPGHILTSFHIYDCAVAWLKSERVRWHNHGKVPLKGYSDDISIHEVYDPGHSSPQVSPPRPAEPKGMYSRAQFSPKLSRPMKIDPANWKILLDSLMSRPLKVHAVSYTVLEDPYSYFADKIRETVSYLVQYLPERPSILWVDASPEDNALEHNLLRHSGCILDLALTPEEAKAKLANRRYLLIITDVTRGPNVLSEIELLLWRVNQRIASPIFLYAHPSAIARNSERAKAEGCMLCTAGVVSLLSGIFDVLGGFKNLIPLERG